MLQYVDVVKEYPRTGSALTGVTFGVARGEFVFLTGPSGSGKSTLLRLAQLAERPTRGVVRVADVDSAHATAADVPRLRRTLGVVFQDFRLLPDRTAEQNVAFALEVTGAPRAAIRTRVAEVLTRVGLAARGTAYPHELSGGEQQRVAIARALANRPLLLLADEPTGNLDDRATRGVFQLLREINAAGTAVVMATHDLELVRRAALRVVELDRGRVVFDAAGGFAHATAGERATGEQRVIPPPGAVAGDAR